MKIDKLAADLPNGLHDALLRSFTVDLVRRRAEFTLEVWIGDIEAWTPGDRERRRAAVLSLTGVSCVSVDPLGAGARPSVSAPVMIDLCDADDTVLSSAMTPDGGFAARFFVSHWNAFIHFAALDASLIWTRSE